jgi:hypothetical protein
VLCEAVHRFFVFVSVVATGVIVSVLLLYHFSFLVIEQLKVLIVICKPWVFINLINCKPLVRIDLKKSTEHASGIF